MNDLRVNFPKPCSENYDDMEPQGCNRFCGSCEKTIHDLSQYDIDEIEQIIKTQDDICVRAQINSDNSIRLKSNNRRRMVVMASASLGILTAACHSVPNDALISDSYASATIKGKIRPYLRYGKKVDYIIALDTNGREYKTKISRNGEYKFSNLPAGEYGLAFESRCEKFVSELNIIVKKSQVLQYDIKPEINCFVVGKLEIQKTIS